MSTPISHLAEGRFARARWPLLLIMALMLAVSVASVLLVSWTRAYLHGHSMWAIAEHRAMDELRSYAATGDAVTYERFRNELAVPLADRTARLQLQSQDPDMDVVHASFLRGNIPEGDIPGLIHLFRLFRHYPLMIRAVETWAAADALIVELDETATAIHALYADGTPDAGRLRELTQRAEGIHARIAPLLRDFAATISAASGQIVSVLLIALPLCALALLAVGVSIFRSHDRRAARTLQSLRELTAQLEHRATHDPLTGLANRSRFEALVSVAVERRHDLPLPTVLLCFDLDRFKVVNDTCGHAAGDELLRLVARRLQSVMPPRATVARLGGDEFGILCPDCSPVEAGELAERLRAAIAGVRFFWSHHEFRVSASIGVVVMGAHIPSVALALRAADQACYAAKDGGRDQVQWYSRDDGREPETPRAVVQLAIRQPASGGGEP